MLFKTRENFEAVELKIPKASAFGGRGHIPLLHPPPMASKAGHAWLHCRLLLFYETEHSPHENPGYASVGSDKKLGSDKN